MTQQLNILAVLAEELSSVPSTMGSKTTSNSNLSCLITSSGLCSHTHAHSADICSGTHAYAVTQA